MDALNVHNMRIIHLYHKQLGYLVYIPMSSLSLLGEKICLKVVYSLVLTKTTSFVIFRCVSSSWHCSCLLQYAGANDEYQAWPNL